jgi:hypothetical protein
MREIGFWNSFSREADLWARPIGIFSGWQRLTGQQFTARGILNLEAGQFT